MTKLLDHHLTKLKYESGLTEETIRQAGIISIEFASQVENLLGIKNAPVPGIWIPYQQGQNTGRYRPDSPGKDWPKYIAPKDVPFRIYLVDKVKKDQPIWIVEGEKKSLAAKQAGLNVLGIGGAWMWHDKPHHDINPEDDNLLHEELRKSIRPENPVTVVFDNDIDTNHNIMYAAGKLLEALIAHGAKASIAFLPHNNAKPKLKGLDDWFVDLKANNSTSDYEACKWLEEKVYEVHDIDKWLTKIFDETQNKALIQNQLTFNRFAKLCYLVYGKVESGNIIKRAAKKFNVPKDLFENWIKAFKRDINQLKNKSPIKLTIPSENVVDIAKAYIKKVEDNDEDLVWFEGGLYKFVVETKTWEPLTDEQLFCDALRIDGSLCGDSFYRVKVRELKEIIEVIKALVMQDKTIKKPPSAIRFKDKTIVVGKGVTEGSKADFCRIYFDFAFKDIPTPEIDGVFTRLFKDDVDAEQKTKLIYQYVGLCALGLGNKHQKILFFADGTENAGGANGKSTLLSLISYCLGSKHVSAVSPTRWDQPFALIGLKDKLINIIHEMPDGEWFNGDCIKTVITGDEVEARFLNKNFIKFSPTCGHIFACNRLPRPKDQSDAFFRRVEIIRFNNSFLGNPDVNIKDKIFKESPGFLVKCVKAALELLKKDEKLVSLESSKQAKINWKEDVSHIPDFIASCLTTEDGADPRSPEFLTVRQVYAAYKIWAEEGGYRPKAEKGLALDLIPILGKSKHTKKGNIWNIKFTSEGMEYFLRGNPIPLLKNM